MPIAKKDLDLLTNLMLEFSKEGGFPFYDKVLESSAMNKVIFSNLNSETYYSELLLEYITKKLQASENTKQGKLLKSKFTGNSKLFLTFALLNVKKDFNDEFNKEGIKVKSLLDEVESELFKSIENSQFKAFSNGLYNKYEKLIKSIFPYINNVGVIIRKMPKS